MKLFFDESGYSGCIMPNKNGNIYNDGQRHFVLAGVFVNDENDEAYLLNKYRQFKKKFGFVDEIKAVFIVSALRSPLKRLGKTNNGQITYGFQKTTQK